MARTTIGGRAARRAALTVVGGLTLAACGGDVDLRDRVGGVFSTGATSDGVAVRPRPDARGLITYPNYQVAVARRGDTARTVATRIGLRADELARFNGVDPDAPLNADAVLALPRQVPGDRPDIATVAGAAIDRAGPSRTVVPAPSGPEPVRHRVARGETAFSIARLYGVSVRSLADWNGLGPDLAVREGQFLLIPLVVDGQVASAGAGVDGRGVTAPGTESALPAPPSASSALPEAVESAVLPPSPNLDQFRTEASAPEPDAAPAPAPVAEPAPQAAAPAATPEADGPLRLRRPVSGGVRTGFSPSNEGIDFDAPAGSAVAAAADGTVAAITRDTEQVPILVLRHGDGLLTVYANIDDITVEKGDTVSAGQRIATVGAPAVLHFELRRGLEPIDPAPFLQ